MSEEWIPWFDAIELYLAHAHARPSAGDAELRDELERIGVAPWLAARLVSWVPVAFAERVLTSMTHAATYTDGARSQRRLDDDPVFVAARRYASGVPAARALSVAERSAIMDAVRSTEPDADLAQLSVLGGTAAIALVEPHPPMGGDDGGVLEARGVMRALFEAHGHPSVPAGDTGARVGTSVLDAFVFPRRLGVPFQAQFDFRIEDPRIEGGFLLESFAGEGPSYRAAVEQALHKFRDASLHVLVATFLDRHACPDQVQWELWPHPGGDRDVCLGPKLILWARVSIDVRPVVDALAEALQQQSLSAKIHTLRFFVAREGTRSLADEVLLDGAPWPAGEAIARSYAWPVLDAAWAVRVFLTLTLRAGPGASRG